MFTYIGYTRNEVLGRNYRFLNGEDTDSLTSNHVKLHFSLLYIYYLYCLVRKLDGTDVLLSYGCIFCFFFSADRGKYSNGTSMHSTYLELQVDSYCPLRSTRPAADLHFVHLNLTKHVLRYFQEGQKFVLEFSSHIACS